MLMNSESKYSVNSHKEEDMCAARNWAFYRYVFEPFILLVSEWLECVWNMRGWIPPSLGDCISSFVFVLGVLPSELDGYRTYAPTFDTPTSIGGVASSFVINFRLVTAVEKVA
jgi:hypothetical protein